MIKAFQCNESTLPILPILDLLGTCMWYPVQGDPLFESLEGFGGGVCV